ncbi:MAG: sulfatase [Spirochaetales bacterium]|nr:sulfatase [Spirochaetales bacterium]
MNFVIIMTDTQRKDMVGAYGVSEVDTPSLDRLASEGIRFERAYTACPLCTPARGALFTGLHPQVNGAICNNVSPHKDIAVMGTIFSHYGYRSVYTGKWHLDGSNYLGDGTPDGGFDPEWWYDKKNFLMERRREGAPRGGSLQTAADLRAAGITLTSLQGHRVASRAVDFLENVQEGEDFILVVSFDEPHGPFLAPPAYWEMFDASPLSEPPNYNAPVDDKPELHRVQRRENGEIPWREYSATAGVCKYFGCNSYIDREIGRVLDAVDARHRDDTTVLYTSDHGDQLRAHGLLSKGPMMYEETCNIPFIVRYPGGPEGVVSNALVSHVDLIPTMLDTLGIAAPEMLPGVSILPILAGDLDARPRSHAMVSFHRFAINGDAVGGFYPVRCITDGKLKLVINLLETDELYDLELDPYEMRNRIADSEYQARRDALHDELMDRMDRMRDPFRGPVWGIREWRQARKKSYRPQNGVGRDKPQGFPFQPQIMPQSETSIRK